MAIFSREPGIASSSLGPPPRPLLEESLRISGMGFLWVGYPSCHPTNSVKTLKGTQSTDPNHWPGLILSSSTTRLLTEATLIPLHQGPYA